MNTETQILIQELLARPIAFHPIFARIAGNVPAGVFLSQAYYWSRIKKFDWFYKTQAEWQEETGLSRNEQETARKRLKALGILEEELRGVPATLYYRINIEILLEAITGKVKPLTVEEILSIYNTVLVQLSKAGLMRAQKLEAVNKFVDYREVLKQKGAVCGICKSAIVKGCGQQGDYLVFDHIQSLEEGGSHTFDNIQPAHAYCNSLKGSDSQFAYTSPSSLSSVSKLDGLGETNLLASGKQTITENTTEITTENTTENETGALAREENASRPETSKETLQPLEQTALSTQSAKRVKKENIIPAPVRAAPVAPVGTVNPAAAVALDGWLDRIAAALGVNGRHRLADFEKWEKACMKAIDDDRALDDFLAVIKSERDRCAETPQFFSPNNCLKILQARPRAVAKPETPTKQQLEDIQRRALEGLKNQTKHKQQTI